jgi:hypothetical protein
MLKKNIWANFQRIIELFTQKIVTKLSKTWVWDPRSGIRKKPIPDSGSRMQGSKKHRIPDPDPQHWNFLAYMMIEYLGPGLACIKNEFSLFNDHPLTLMADLSTVLYY